MAISPLVSIIIPCYNYGRFLNDSLGSILSQTYQNWECIIIDDGSTDNTKEIALQFTLKDARFKYIYQNNLGLAGARNTAFKHALGEYIQLLDADDMLEKEKLALQVPLFEIHPEIDLIYSNMLLFKHESIEREYTTFKFKVPVASGKGEQLINSLIFDNFFLPGCTIFRRRLYEQVGYFKPDMGGLEDWNYWFRAALVGCIFYNDSRPGTRLLVRVHGNNMSANHKKMEKGRIKAREDLMSITKELEIKGKLNLSPFYVAKTNKFHKALLNRDQARLNLFYDNVFKGVRNAIKHAYYSGKPYFALYDAAYWIKERVKKNWKR
jgi:glycosyltransferase involved in cell wall biosynthesis